MYDNVVRNATGLVYFVSAITGVTVQFQKPFRYSKVHPAVAYWVVLESAYVDAYALIRTLQSTVPNKVEVKLLQEPPIISAIEKQHNILCIVMKDHGDGFVKNKIQQSFTVPGDQGTGLATRLVGMTDHAKMALLSAKGHLQSAGISVDVL